MTEWDDRVSNHQTTQLITDLPTKLESLPRPKEQKDAEALDRLKDVADHLRRLLDNSDSQLVTQQMLDAPSAGLTEMHRLLDLYAQDNGVDYIHQANTYADSTLSSLGSWPVVRGPTDVEGLRKSIQSYRQSASQHVKALEDEVAERRAQLESLDPKLDEIGTRIDGEVNRLTEQIASLEPTINEAKQQINTAISE